MNCAGNLVGIPSAGATVPSPSGESAGGNIGLGFAIPVNLARTISDELIATGTVTHAYLGLEAQPLSVDATTVDGRAEGLLVTAVDPTGPAAAAGLRAGDVIVSIDGEPATGTDQLAALSLQEKPGAKVALVVDRAGRRLHLTVALGSLP